MERTYERRRSGSSAGRAGRRQAALDPREKRRLIQLGVSVGLFLAVFFGRGLLDAGPLAGWRARLGESTDFRGAFSRFGAAVSGGGSVGDALGELWAEVFAGGPVQAQPPGEEWKSLPAFSRRLAEQIAAPQDPVGQWAVRAARAWAEAQSGEEEPDPAPAGEEDPTAQPLLVLRPLAATAQTTDGEGRRLPRRVSLEYYDLNLRVTAQPVSAPLTSGFGFRDSPVTGKEEFHYGADLGAEEGTPILAYAGGVVTFAGESRSYGDYLTIDHGGGVTTLYAHCQKLLVREGQRVAAGEEIATVGQTGIATGPHLHFSVLKNDIYLDPLYYLAPA